MSTQYAIEIISGISVTDTDFGCQSGTFRFITGTPGYDGGTPYPIWEDWSDNTNIWYEGFITKDGLSNPSRQIDISISGDYGVLSGFNFTIRNTEKFWNFVKTNNIYLVNKTVKFYTVISDTFFQAWQGVVSNNPMDEINYQFQCNSDFRKIHKYLPPEVITKTNYEDATTDLSKTIPVSLGDIPYAKLMKVENIEQNFKTLVIKNGASHESAAALAYYTGGSGVLANTLQLITYGVTFAANELVDCFLVATSGDGAATDAIIRIVTNEATVQPISKWYQLTVVGLAEPLKVTTMASFNNVANHLKYDTSNPTGDANWVAATADTWWFKIFSIDVSTQLSNSTIYSFQKLKNQIQLYSWDTDLKKFVDIKDLISYDESTGNVKILANNVNEDGEVTVTSRIPSTIKKASYDVKYTTGGGFGSGTNNYPIADSYLPHFSDGSRTNYYEITGLSNGINTQPRKVAIHAIIDPTSISSLQNYDDIFLGMDLTITNPYSFSMWYELITRDIYGYRLTDMSVSDIQIYPAKTCAIPTTYNFLSNEYYRSTTNSISLDSGSYFGEMQTLNGSDCSVNSKLALSDNLVTALKAGSITEIDLRVYLSQSDYRVNSINIKVKEIGFLGSRVIATIKGDIYTKIKGETTHSEETNHVYNAFRHILEDYDGIAESNIDYGNLSTTRNTWHLGRQITERQSSFEYIQELCRQSFVCAFPTRTGKIGLSAWRENTDSPVTHNQASIVRNSIKNYEKTKIQDLFNEFYLKFNYNSALGDFERAMFIDKVEESSFPLSTDDNWKKYFGGLENDSYQEAKTLWDICHESYTRANAISSNIPSDISELYFYIDVNTFSDEVAYNIYKGTKSSTYLFLKNLVEWSSRQKDSVDYAIPINSTNIKSELLNPVIFNDSIYTNSIDRTGWVSKIEIDTKKDQILIKTTLEPYDIITVEDDLIVETGSADTTITESGSQPDTITEV